MKNILPFNGIAPKIAETAFVAPNAFIVGDVEIGEDSGIWYACTLRGDSNIIRVGNRVNIQDGTVVHVSSKGQGTFIGDDVTIGHLALIHACTLEKNCFIGMKACVMDGAVVEEGAMVAAGALVGPGKIVKSGELWAGIPAKPIRKLTETDQKMIDWTAPHYVELAHDHKKVIEEG